MTAISDVIKDIPKKPWYGNDNSMRKCPDCDGSGINYCGMCRRPLTQWAMYRSGDQEAVKIMNINGREYPLNSDDLLAMRLILRLAGFTEDKNKVGPEKPPLKWTKREFNQVYYGTSALHRMSMDLMVDDGSILIVKENEKKIDQPAVRQTGKRRGRPRKSVV